MKSNGIINNKRSIGGFFNRDIQQSLAYNWRNSLQLFNNYLAVGLSAVGRESKFIASISANGVHIPIGVFSRCIFNQVFELIANSDNSGDGYSIER